MILGIEILRPASVVSPGTVLPAGPAGLTGPEGPEGPPGPQGNPGVADLANDDHPGLIAAGERATLAAVALILTDADSAMAVLNVAVPSLPTSLPPEPGRLWNQDGILSIS